MCVWMLDWKWQEDFEKWRTEDCPNSRQVHKCQGWWAEIPAESLKGLENRSGVCLETQVLWLDGGEAWFYLVLGYCLLGGIVGIFAFIIFCLNSSKNCFICISFCQVFAPFIVQSSLRFHYHIFLLVTSEKHCPYQVPESLNRRSITVFIFLFFPFSCPCHLTSCISSC